MIRSYCVVRWDLRASNVHASTIWCVPHAPSLERVFLQLQVCVRLVTFPMRNTYEQDSFRIHSLQTPSAIPRVNWTSSGLSLSALASPESVVGALASLSFVQKHCDYGCHIAPVDAGLLSDEIDTDISPAFAAAGGGPGHPDVFLLPQADVVADDDDGAVM